MSKSHKGKGNDIGFAILAGIFILAAIFILFIFLLGNILGLGTGSGNGQQNSQAENGTISRLTDDTAPINNPAEVKNENANSADPDNSETSEKTVIVMLVNISGSDYIYNNDKTDIDTIIESYMALEDEAEIHISPRSDASYSAVHALTDALDEKNIKYVMD